VTTALRFFGLLSIAFASGCGTSDGNGGPGGGSSGASGGAASGSGGTAGSSSGGAQSGGAASGGSATGGNASGGAQTGGSGGGGAGCAGAFGAAELLFSVEPPMDLGGPSITADELELFYSLDTGAGLATFVVTKRAAVTDAFPAAAAVPGLAGCSTPFGTMDISDDGLRLYYACWSDAAAMVSVEFADRTDRESAFEARGVLATMGGSPAIDSAELTLYSGGLNGGSPIMAERDIPSGAFGDAQGVPGLATSTLGTPDLSPDGLVLFGAQAGMLGFVTRADVTSPFGSFSPLPGIAANSGAPSISADCRTLYFAGRTNSGGRGVFAARR
jgi:hypothetical protein